MNEAREMMRGLYALRPDDALDREQGGDFGSLEYFDPRSMDLNVVDGTEWLAETRKCQFDTQAN